jgi:hypothetical protein
MAPKTTLNAKNLEALGAERLAALLIEISTGSAASKRRLRLELAGAQSTADVSREVRKRLSSIDRSRTVIDWRKIKAVRADLETQRATITGSVAEEDPDEAVDLLWRLLDLSGSILSRCNTSSDSLIACFHAACADLGRVARKASSKRRQRLPEQILSALRRNDEHQYSPLIQELAPAMGEEGLKELQSLLRDWLEEPPEGRDSTGRATDSSLYAELQERARRNAARAALEDIADALGDVDAYIAEQSEKGLTLPEVGAEIADRLLKAGRAEEALKALDRATPTGTGRIHEFEWQDARCNVLETLGRLQEAQAFRLLSFEQSLSPEHLRAYLKRLPDFDDMEAEEKALDFVARTRDIDSGLHFFMAWPALARAARLVIDRSAELDGDDYEMLTGTAEVLTEKYPLAATILLRAMIDFALDQARTSRYRHAARHLVECTALAARIADFGAFEDHQTYVARLRSLHGRKHGFWSAVR